MTDHQVGDVIYYVTTAPFPGDGIDIITHLADGIATLRDGPYLFTEEIRETIKHAAKTDRRRHNTPPHLLPDRQPPTREHGTNRGYRQHRARGEPACTDCKQAHAEYVAERSTRGPAPGTGRQPIRHGTNAGYAAHLRHQSDPCDACLEAHAQYVANGKTRRRKRSAA